MRYPKLKTIPETRQVQQVFRGLNRNARIPETEFRQMENLTSDHYPLLAPRPPRRFYRKPASPQGLIAKDTLCYVDGSDFLLGDTRIPMGLSVEPEDCPKQLVSMGAYVLIFPDKAYINTGDPADRGLLDAVFTSAGTVTVTPCGEDGQETDTPQYLRLENPGIGADFAAGDGVEISGCTAVTGSVRICARGDDYLVVAGTGEETTQQTPLTVSRRCPRLDFVCQCGNRLWGCRYGKDREGEFVNRIYACRLGDFKNWNVFQGLSTDAYAAACGEDGPFTGAVSYLGNPLFFKEKGVYQVYGSYPATFTIRFTACPGVQQGCEKSLAMTDDTLFYVSRGGVYAYDGSLPVEVSRDLGAFSCDRAVGGSYGSKYYLSAHQADGWNLYVYDTAYQLWHREDRLQVYDFCTLRGQLYCVDGENCNILCLTDGDGTEEKVRWSAETGELGFSSPDGKYLTGLILRLQLDRGSKMLLSACCDGGGDYEELATVFGTGLQSFEIPVRPRRCDHFRLKIEGEGSGKVYSITKRLQLAEM